MSKSGTRQGRGVDQNAAAGQTPLSREGPRPEDLQSSTAGGSAIGSGDSAETLAKSERTDPRLRTLASPQ